MHRYRGRRNENPGVFALDRKAPVGARRTGLSCLFAIALMGCRGGTPPTDSLTPGSTDTPPKCLRLRQRRWISHLRTENRRLGQMLGFQRGLSRKRGWPGHAAGRRDHYGDVDHHLRSTRQLEREVRRNPGLRHRPARPDRGGADVADHRRPDGATPHLSVPCGHLRG